MACVGRSVATVKLWRDAAPAPGAPESSDRLLAWG